MNQSGHSSLICDGPKIPLAKQETVVYNATHRPFLITKKGGINIMSTHTNMNTPQLEGEFEHLLADVLSRARSHDIATPTLTEGRDDEESGNQNAQTEVRSLEEILAKPEPRRECLLPGLIEEGRNVLVRVSKDVDAQPFALALGLAMAAGSQFAPFGKPKPTETLLVLRTANRIPVSEQLKFLHDDCLDSAERKHALTNLNVAEDPPEILWYSRFDWLKDVARYQLVILFDRHRFNNEKELNVEELENFQEIVGEWNKKGISVVAFIGGDKKLASILEDCFFSLGNNWLQLDADSGAPTEFGGGVKLTRSKMSETDLVPLSFNLRYAVIDGKMSRGWTYGHSSDGVTEKQIQVAERRIRAAQMREKGMPQKDIATELGVDPSTISRDISKISKDRRADSNLNKHDSSN